MKYVFYVSDQNLTVYSHGNTGDNLSNVFDWKEVEQIDAFLANMNEKAETDVVLDLIDEELHFEWAPKVHFWERQGIASRRKERLHTDSTLLTQVKWSGISRLSEEGRKEELLMSASVADSYNVSTFLQSLEEAQAIVRKIHSKAFLLEQYLNKKVRPFLKLSKPQLKKPFLMVTRQSKNVFRQSFFFQGELRLSRLVEVDESYQSFADIRKALLTETKLAVAYVYNQKIIPFNSPLGFLFLDGEQEMLDGILAECQEEGLIRSTWDEGDFFVGTANFRRVSSDGYNCQQDNQDCYSKQAVSDFVLMAKPQGFYQNDFVRKINYLIAGKSAFVTVNILLFVFGLSYALISGIDSWVSWEKQKLLEQKIAQHENEKKRLENMVQLQDDAQRIKASVEFSEAILTLKVNRLISFDINAISDVFANHEHIQLRDIKWSNLDRLDSRRNQIDIQALVFPFYETYHDPVMWVDNFVKDLRAIKGMESVSLQKEPLNRNLKQTLSISTNANSVEALPFTVSLRIKDVEFK